MKDESTSPNFRSYLQKLINVFNVMHFRPSREVQHGRPNAFVLAIRVENPVLDTQWSSSYITSFSHVQLAICARHQKGDISPPLLRRPSYDSIFPLVNVVCDPQAGARLSLALEICARGEESHARIHDGLADPEVVIDPLLDAGRLAELVWLYTGTVSEVLA